MSEIYLQPWQDRSYGVFANGYVEENERQIAVHVFSPHPEINDSNAPKLINFNGLAVGAESMRVPAEVAAELGYVAVTFDYPNTTERLTPIERNAKDGLIVMDAFNADEYRLLGLSMGGAIATMVAAQSERPISNLDLVSPAGYIDKMIGLDMHTVLDAFEHEYFDELAMMTRFPRAATTVALNALANCRRRPAAVLAELKELFRVTVYQDLAKLRRSSPDTVVTLAHGSHDRLVPSTELLSSLHEHEVAEGMSLVDIKVPYPGPHPMLTCDPRLTERVLRASVNFDPRNRK